MDVENISLTCKLISRIQIPVGESCISAINGSVKLFEQMKLLKTLFGCFSRKRTYV